MRKAVYDCAGIPALGITANCRAFPFLDHVREFHGYFDQVQFRFLSGLSCEEHLSDPQTKISVYDDDFAMRDELAVKQQVRVIVDLTVQFENRARAEFENILQQNVTAAKAQRNVQL